MARARYRSETPRRGVDPAQRLDAARTRLARRRRRRGVLPRPIARAVLEGAAPRRWGWGGGVKWVRPRRSDPPAALAPRRWGWGGEVKWARPGRSDPPPPQRRSAAPSRVGSNRSRQEACQSAALQRVAHRRGQLGDRDPVIAVAIERFAYRDVRRVETDLHPYDQFVDGHKNLKWRALAQAAN